MSVHKNLFKIEKQMYARNLFGNEDLMLVKSSVHNISKNQISLCFDFFW